MVNCEVFLSLFCGEKRYRNGEEHGSPDPFGNTLLTSGAQAAPTREIIALDFSALRGKKVKCLQDGVKVEHACEMRMTFNLTQKGDMMYALGVFQQGT